MRLDPGAYRAAIAVEAGRLAAAARLGLDLPVPPCPGWVVRDVVGHTGSVHRQKLAIVRDRLQRREDTPDLETPPGDDRLIVWFEQGVAALLAVLDADPSIPVYTWIADQQTVGFWQRRMAHETAIHRADAESAHGQVTPLDPALAADGIDEVLGMMAGYPDDPVWEFAADGRTAVVRAADTGDVRTLRLGSGKYGPGWLYEEGAIDHPDAEIAGGASDLDLWAWGRGPRAALTVTGDPAIADEIREVVAGTTG